MITTMTVHTPHGPSKVNAIQTIQVTTLTRIFEFGECACYRPYLLITNYYDLLQLKTTTLSTSLQNYNKNE